MGIFLVEIAGQVRLLLPDAGIRGADEANIGGIALQSLFMSVIRAMVDRDSSRRSP